VPRHFLTDLAALRVSTEEFLAAVLETAAQPIWVVDRKGVLRFASPAAITALGYDSADELLGRDSHATIHYKHPDGTPYPAAECPMLRPRTTGETVTSDLDWFCRRDGSMFPVSYVSVPIEMVDGRGAVVAFSDAGGRVREERLRREHVAILAAQRRVATLVAGGAASADVFAAIAREVGRVIGLSLVAVLRHERDGEMVTVMGAWGERPHPFRAGARWPLDAATVTAHVIKTGRPARIDDLAGVPGTFAAAGRGAGVRSGAAAPIFVDGEIWGTIGTAGGEPLPDGIEDRLGEFTELVATAISNTEARTEVEASRARIVAAADEERWRVVRDLHDGAQQRLVHTIITLKLARRALENGQEDHPALLGEALGHAEQATTELRELAHGILPHVLTHGGLRAGVDALGSRMPVPIDIDVTVGRLPAAVEATAYFIVAEALTNVAKHAHARHASVAARVEHGTLRVHVRDDGIGGARPDGSGLVGLADRLAVLDGQLRIETPDGGGTLVAADIPLPR
jgi:PAS domain S-box-containing protein